MLPNSFGDSAVRLERDGIPRSAKQSRERKLRTTTEGASTMKGFDQIRKIIGVAGVLLLLIAVAGVSMSAQSLNPVPWPTPATVPPPNAVIPAFQTRPAGVLLAGQIQYASLDPTPGLCNKDDNPAPT